MDAVFECNVLVKAKNVYVETNNKPQGAYLLHTGEYAL